MPSASLARRRPSAASRGPTFLYIGTPKAGSTWIYDALRQHPDVFIPSAKDLWFFDRQYHRGWHWYLGHFEKARTAAAIGEISHDYYVSGDAAWRIRRDLPDVRLICCLREPGDFAISLLRWWHAHTLRFGNNFSEMRNHPMFARYLAYRANLEVYFDLFSRDQILVVYYEQLKSNPLEFLTELYRFIGVDAVYYSETLTTRSNVARTPRSRIVAISAVETAEVLRRLGLANLIGSVKQTSLLYKLIYANNSIDRQSSRLAELDRIADAVRRETAGELNALAQLIGKPLPSEWVSARTRQL